MTAQQLKASILQLAIQGKLVPQNPADEPASVLLKKIKAEKDALVKAGKIKKENPLPPISEDEITFDIPDSWEWVRLETVSLVIHYGFTASASNQGNAKLLRITDIQDGIVSWKDVPFCMVTQNELEKYQLQNRDILIARTGGTIGKTYIVNGFSGTAVFASYLIRVVPSQLIDERFLKFFMESPLYWSELKNASAGTGQPNVNGQALRMLYLPFPPLEEQARIVAKIEELLPHVEEYRKAETELSKLNAELPEQLKKSILQWAIQGRLVPQDPTDEPASELLKRIKAEKAALIKSGKLKKEKPLPPISEDEIPFDIPDSWEWVRLGTVLLPTQNKKPSGEHFDYIDIDAVDNVANRIREPKHIPVAQASSRAIREIAPGDVLFSLVRPYLKNIALVEKIHADCIASSGFYVCRPSCGIDSAFLFHLMVSDYVVSGINSSIKGFNSPSVRPDNITDFLVPLPPLAEQKRIVKKLETILSVIHHFYLK